MQAFPHMKVCVAIVWINRLFHYNFTINLLFFLQFELRSLLPSLVFPEATLILAYCYFPSEKYDSRAKNSSD